MNYVVNQSRLSFVVCHTVNSTQARCATASSCSSQSQYCLYLILFIVMNNSSRVSGRTLQYGVVGLLRTEILFTKVVLDSLYRNIFWQEQSSLTFSTILTSRVTQSLLHPHNHKNISTILICYLQYTFLSRLKYHYFVSIFFPVMFILTLIASRLLH